MILAMVGQVEFFDLGQCRFAAIYLGVGKRAVQRGDRRIRNEDELIVKLYNMRPLVFAGGGGMPVSDASFQMIPRHGIAATGVYQVVVAARDQRLVPQPFILLVE